MHHTRYASFTRFGAFIIEKIIDFTASDIHTSVSDSVFTPVIRIGFPGSHRDVVLKGDLFRRIISAEDPGDESFIGVLLHLNRTRVRVELLYFQNFEIQGEWKLDSFISNRATDNGD